MSKSCLSQQRSGVAFFTNGHKNVFLQVNCFSNLWDISHFPLSFLATFFDCQSQLSQRKRSRQTSCFAIIWFSPFSRQWQYKGNNERSKNKEIFTRTWVWGLVLRVRVRSVRVWNVRVTSSACIYQLLWWVRALCALKQCKTGHKRFLFT